MANVKIGQDPFIGGLTNSTQAAVYADRLNASLRKADLDACFADTVKKFETVSYGMMVRNDGLFHIAVERIENGYLLKVARNEGDVFKTYYAPDLKAAGEQITALAVTYELGGEDGKKA